MSFFWETDYVLIMALQGQSRGEWTDFFSQPFYFKMQKYLLHVMYQVEKKPIVVSLPDFGCSHFLMNYFF
jgi:hypothetical protein